jgi:hypothetical protein
MAMGSRSAPLAFPTVSAMVTAHPPLSPQFPPDPLYAATQRSHVPALGAADNYAADNQSFRPNKRPYRSCYPGCP